MAAPRGTYTFWRWPAHANGASSLAWDLTVLRDPGATTYFWAHQWSFERGDVGYFGLQAHDLRDDGSTGRLAVLDLPPGLRLGGRPRLPTAHRQHRSGLVERDGDRPGQGLRDARRQHPGAAPLGRSGPGHPGLIDLDRVLRRQRPRRAGRARAGTSSGPAS